MLPKHLDMLSKGTETLPKMVISIQNGVEMEVMGEFKALDISNTHSYQ